MNQYLSLIKFSHTIFALPFALLGFFLAIHKSNESISWLLLSLVLLCMIFARSAAMAFNRYLDKDIDKLNPRTAQREIPSGAVSAKAALTFVILNAALFIATTWFINPICFYLSPIALIVILGYSYTKRFTWLCHFVLGMGLGLAPVGAYLAVMGQFEFIPILYGFAVLFWVSGFDIIYALQDEEFDKSLQLRSIPETLGKKKALQLSTILHIICGSIILFSSYQLSITYPQFGWLNWLAAAAFIALLVYQHTLVKPNDLSKVNLAFFTTNGIASLLFGGLIILDFYI